MALRTLRVAREEQEAKAREARAQREALLRGRQEKKGGVAQQEAAALTAGSVARTVAEMQQTMSDEVLEADAWSRILPATPVELKVRVREKAVHGRLMAEASACEAKRQEDEEERQAMAALAGQTTVPFMTVRFEDAATIA